MLGREIRIKVCQFRINILLCSSKLFSCYLCYQTFIGLEYIKANGELCEKKKLGPPCTCKEKCYIKIGTEACEKIFQNFWKLGDHSLQNAYIGEL